MPPKKSQKVKDEEAKVKALQKQQKDLEKSLKATVKATTKAEKKLKKATLDVEKTTEKLEKMKIIPAVPFVNCQENRPWAVKCLACVFGDYSGSRADDIKVLVKKPSKGVIGLRDKITAKEVEILIESKGKTVTLDDCNLARQVLKTMEEEESEYKAPLNVFHRDHQQVKNGKPIPIVGAHTIFAAFRDTINDAFPMEFKIYGPGHTHTGWPSIKHLKNFVKVNPHHVKMYKTMKGKPGRGSGYTLTDLITADDIVIDGQQPVGLVAGFQFFELIRAPFYFEFTITFHPKGKFPMLADRELVGAVIEQAFCPGAIGARRGANFGMYNCPPEHIELVNVKSGVISKKLKAA